MTSDMTMVMVLEDIVVYISPTWPVGSMIGVVVARLVVPSIDDWRKDCCDY